MKYIKLFESDDNYVVGDYVKIKMIPDYAKKFSDAAYDDYDLYTKITDISKSKGIEEPIYKFQYPNETFIYGYVFLIKRRMNKEEIDEYKLKEEAKKYNL